MIALHKMYSPEEVVPEAPDALPRGYLNPRFVQDEANEVSHDVLRLMTNWLADWRDAAHRGKQRDPAFIVAKYRETAQELFRRANLVEDQIKQVSARRVNAER